jgi:hypothetical protein
MQALPQRLHQVAIPASKWRQSPCWLAIRTLDRGILASAAEQAAARHGRVVHIGSNGSCDWSDDKPPGELVAVTSTDVSRILDAYLEGGNYQAPMWKSGLTHSRAVTV